MFYLYNEMSILNSYLIIKRRLIFDKFDMYKRDIEEESHFNEDD